MEALHTSPPPTAAVPPGSWCAEKKALELPSHEQKSNEVYSIDRIHPGEQWRRQKPIREGEKGALQHEYIRHESDGLVWISAMREKGALQHEYIRHESDGLVWISDMREKRALQHEYLRHESDGLVWISDMREKGALQHKYIRH